MLNSPTFPTKGVSHDPGKATQLIRCPHDLKKLAAFVAGSGAVETPREDGFVLHSIPRE
jgi:hypothetical protein